ncbi:hypothetical protein LPJ59_006777 [Coemansia sp. RSA 2399]|nr:hypothetical protein LPJ59_006777 [Coemansia sp. RSA 2399]
MNALPPRYCDVSPEQRPSPSLVLVKQANSAAEVENDQEAMAKQRMSNISHASRSTHRHPTISSTHSSNHRLTMSTVNTIDGTGEESYRTRKLPPPPPPLPLAPMPTSVYMQPGAIPSPGGAQSPGIDGSHSRDTSISSQPHSRSQSRQCNDESRLVLSPLLPEESMRHSDTTVVQQGFGHMSLNGSIRSAGGGYRADALSGGTASQPRTPMSLGFGENMSPDAGSDDDAGYFKSSAAKVLMERERPSERGSLFRLRKNSSIKQSRREPELQVQYPLP